MPEMTAIVACCVMTLACASCAKSFLEVTRAGDYGRAFWLKGAAGLCFLALGLLTASRCPDAAFAWKVAGGLLLGLVGDQLLALRFIRTERFDAFFTAGALSFAAGHGLYIWALLSRCPAALTPGLVLAAALFAGSLVYLKKNDFHAGKMDLSARAYILVVVLMGSLALASALRGATPDALLFALGGLCFIVSDNVLCVYSFGGDRRFGLNVLLHAAYYAAQLAIGWSLFFMG